MPSRNPRNASRKHNPKSTSAISLLSQLDDTPPAMPRSPSLVIDFDPAPPESSQLVSAFDPDIECVGEPGTGAIQGFYEPVESSDAEDDPVLPLPTAQQVDSFKESGHVRSPVLAR